MLAILPYDSPLLNSLMYAHLITVIPCIFIGGYLLLAYKGTPIHKLLGKIYMSLMLVTAVITVFLPANVGPQLLDHFGWIHLFTVLTLWTIPTAYIAIRKRHIKAHKRKMIFLYVGAIKIAGGFTLVPGRYLHGVIFG
ncbi:Uncharacterized membrane protein [Nonlabens sp. Hel1_33_55]|uniref:DUF2306 domain-containing protein n=1 Tax=Nonlabens sp. Hel1_33_55 TaxID=1336802 RepID=UPI000875D2F3|nr:DUF2306 domain-containing protein [Nonlabens sp. Hel1_33_55]SCY17619.1 Uncharacterized membrane protein [Nonlabens sp. Hel1_33_55]